ncbi:MAG: hypothetical protein JXR95_13845 [Deltaproteobacteria bacterium]|nr:hypothetical protein [Deltaproteobacteria bacterium]
MKSIITLSAVIMLFTTGVSAQKKSFEKFASGSVFVSSMEKIAGPFLQKCGNTDELPDLHCRAIRSYMQRRVSTKTFRIFADSGALDFGEYDNTKFSYKVSVKGCVTCKKPVMFDPLLFGQRSFLITAKKPTKLKNGLPEGVDLHSFEIPVDPRELGKWSVETKPYLRVEFLFRVEKSKVWDPKFGEGLTLTVGGYRVVNRCNGDVLYSDPPSKGKGQIVSDGCRKVVKIKKINPDKLLPKRPSNSVILGKMRSIREKIKECYTTYQIPGVAKLSIKVNGSDGKVSKVRLKGAFSETPTGSCITKHVESLVFPRFKNKKIVFSYKYVLP